METVLGVGVRWRHIGLCNTSAYHTLTLACDTASGSCQIWASYRYAMLRGARLDADEQGRAWSLFYCVHTGGLKQTASTLNETEMSPRFCLVMEKKRWDNLHTSAGRLLFFACETSEVFNMRPSHNGEQKEKFCIPSFCHFVSFFYDFSLATDRHLLRQIVLLRPRTHL